MANDILYSKKGFIMSTKAQIEQVGRDIEALMANKKELEVKLEGENKPVLRHGDYGYSVNSGSAMAMKKFGTGRLSRVSDACIHTVCCDADDIDGIGDTDEIVCGTGIPSTVLGNIFDDLTAMQEDVTEFEMESNYHPSEAKIQVRLIGECIQLLDYDGKCINIWTESNPDFFKNIRQMEATMQRSKK